MAKEKKIETQASPVEVKEEPEEGAEGILEGEVVEKDQEGTTEIISEKLDALQAELAESQAKADEYLDGWQRALAEFANYKKRVERDQALFYQNAAGSIIKRYLEVLDDLERALKNRPQEGEGAAWANGVELIYRKLTTILESEGVKPMEAEGKTFDPNLHEAITLEESDSHESGQIIEVLQRGYVMGDRVLRPAMVRVAK
jgi:molecular chaperone GrpE